MSSAGDGSRAGAETFWLENARRYDRAVAVLNRRFSRMTAMVADDLRGRGRVLEVAAGTGLVTAAISPVVGELIATDQSAEMLQILRGRMLAEGLTNVSVLEADALALQLPNSSVDSVVAANLLHLLPEPGRALDEFRRVLAPGGVLCVPTFGHGQTLLAGVVSRLLAWRGFPVVSRFDSATLVGLIKEHGFVAIREDVVPGVLPLLCLTARPVL